MKTFIVMAALLLGLDVAAQQITFDYAEHDFGSIAERAAEVKHDFPFTNTGSSPLVITRTQTSCSCTKALFPKKPVMPGQRGVITVVYDPKRQSGALYKAIQIYSNDSRGRQVITVKGVVVN